MNGSIDHRADRSRSWRARYPGPDGRQHSKSFHTKDEAQRWLRSEVGKLDRGTWVDPAGGTRLYRDYAPDWLAGKVNIKEKTLAWYEGLLRSRVLPTFGAYQLRRIDPSNVRNWVSAMADEGLSPARIRHAHQVLRATLQQAVGDGLIGRNPADGVDLPRQDGREMLFLNAHELDRLAQIADSVRHGEGALVTFLGYSGLRWSEVVALRHKSIDLISGRVSVAEAATEIGGRLVFGTPKSHRQRTVIVPRSIAGLLVTRLTMMSADRLVFSAPEGGPLRSSNFRKTVWLPAVERLGAEYPHLLGLRVHDLRHTAASLAISCGANIKVVQRMLGHRNASMTLDRYGHLFTEDLEAVADRLEKRFLGVA